MPVFEFRDYTLALTIAGNDFNVNCVSELADKVQGHKKTLSELAGQITAGEKTSDDAVDVCRQITDDILGAGAFESVFKGRTPTVTDCSDVLLFVVGEITEQFKKQNPGNRAARRAGQKTAGGKK